WEGTSNIVALDVMRAIRRNQCFPALRAHIEGLLEQGKPCPAALSGVQRNVLDKVWELAWQAAEQDNSPLARQAASALYNALAMAALRWEAAQPGLASRGDLADLVLVHKLAAHDPCVAMVYEADEEALLQAAYRQQH